MYKVKYVLPLVAAAVLLLAPGCGSTGANVTKTRGVYTTLAVYGRHLDLPGSAYASCKVFGPGQTPEAVVTGYGDWDGANNRPQPFTLQLIEAGSGNSVFSQDGDAYYDKAETMLLPIRKTGDYQLKLLINGSVYDTWDFTVQGSSSAGATAGGPSSGHYAEGIFGCGLETSSDLEAFHQYDDNLMSVLLREAQKEAGAGDETIFTQVYPGKVGIDFTLHADGRIESPKITENTLNDKVGAFFLHVLNTRAPYPAWPAEARQSLGRDSLNIHATFTLN